MIKVSNLSFSYGLNSSISFPNLSIEPNEHVLLLGESGSGKTTLLHLLGGLLRNYTGSITIGGTELSVMSEKALDSFRGKKIGFIFQKNHLISALTVEDNVKMSPYLAGIPLERSRVDAVLNQLNLDAKKNSYITQLSHGQAQRVAIARAILNKPAILLADEPTSALDDKNCERVADLLMESAATNGAILIIATHDNRLKERFPKHILLR